MNKLIGLSVLLLASHLVWGQECDIIWQNVAGTAFSGTTLTKTSGGSTGWDAAARSTQTIPADSDGYIIHEVTVNDKTHQFGLNEADVSVTGSDLDYVLYFRHKPTSVNRSVRANLNGSILELGQYNLGDKYRIRRTGNMVYVDKMAEGTSSWVNNLHSASAYLSGVLPELFADVSMSTLNGTIVGAKISYGLRGHVRLESKLLFDHVSIDLNAIQVVFAEKFSDYNLSDLDIVLNEEDGTDRSNLINSVQVNSGVNYIEKGNNYLQVNFTAGLVSSTNVANKNITSYILTIKDSKGNSFSKRFIYEP